MIRLVDCYQPPAGVVNSTSSPAPVRPVELENVQTAGSVLRLGPEGEAMIARLSPLNAKPAVTGQVPAMPGQYMQARYVYAGAGMWNPELAAFPQPFLEPGFARAW